MSAPVARLRRPYGFRGRFLTRIDLAQQVERHPGLRELREALSPRLGALEAEREAEAVLARALEEVGEEMLAEAERDIDAIVRTWSRLADAYRSAVDRAEMGRIALELSELPARLEERVRLLPDSAGMIADAIPTGVVARLRYPVAAGRLTPDQLLALGRRLKTEMPRAIALELQRLDSLDWIVQEAVTPMLVGLRAPLDPPPAARAAAEVARWAELEDDELKGRLSQGCLVLEAARRPALPPSADHLVQGIEGLAISSDGTVALWGPWEPWVRVLDADAAPARSGPAERRLGPEDGRAWWRHCLAAAIGPGGRLGAAGGSSITVWDLSSGRVVVDLEPSAEDELHALAFSPCGRLLAAARADGTLTVYELASGEVLWRVDLQEAALAICWTPDGQRLLAGGWTGILTVHRADTGGRLAAFDEVEGSINGLAADPRGARVATGAGAGCGLDEGLDLGEVALRIWDAHNGAVLRDLRGIDSPVVQVGWVDCGLVFICDDGSLNLYDPDSGRRLGRVELATVGEVPSALAAAGTRVLVGTESGSVFVFRLDCP